MSEPKVVFRRPLKNGEGFYPAWIRQMHGRSGVYVIRCARTSEPLYVGESHTGRLKTTLTRHLQRWKGPGSGPTYDPAEVSWSQRPGRLRAWKSSSQRFSSPETTRPWGR